MTRVTFGIQLSPEIFDYRRPPATPIRKGATPLRCSSSRQSIIKCTPLKATRETVKALDLTSSFQLTPSPEPEPKVVTKVVNIAENTNIMATPEKPTQRKSARRKSSLFHSKEETKSDKDEGEKQSTPSKDKMRRRTTGSSVTRGKSPNSRTSMSRYVFFKKIFIYHIIYIKFILVRLNVSAVIQLKLKD